MKIGIDIRALDTDYVTGVDTYLRSVLRQWLDIKPDHKFVLFGTKKLQNNEIVKAYTALGNHFVAQPWPNKIFNSSLVFLKKPPLDEIAGGVDPVSSRAPAKGGSPADRGAATTNGVDVYFLPNPTFWAFSKNVPVVATFHDLAYRRLQNIYSAKRLLWHKAVGLDRLASRADRLIAVSEATKNDLQKIYNTPASKIDVTHLGVDEKFRNQQGIKPKGLPAYRTGRPDNYILFIGSIEPRKNLQALLKAFEILRSQFSDLHLVIAGGFSPQKDNKVIRKIKSDPKTLFIGPVDENEKFGLYKNAKVLVLPSLYEGFGLQIAEGFAAGVPVVTSTSSSMPEVAASAAVLVNPFNSSDIAAAVKSILTNSSFRGTLISRGYEVVQNYNWKDTAQKTLEIIENTANAHHF